MRTMEIYLRENIDEIMLNFIRDHLNSFDKLSLVRFFGWNEAARVDCETLAEVTAIGKGEVKNLLRELVQEHIVEEFSLEGCKLYELTQNKFTRDMVKTLNFCYRNRRLHKLIVAYIVKRSVNDKVANF